MKIRLRRLLLCGVVGLMAGLAAALFLSLLNIVTDFRDEHEEIVWLLPFAGLIIGGVYWRWAGRASKGVVIIFEELHAPRERLPLRMAPLVLGGTLMTHLFGGSAGREGTAVQMGAALADQLQRFVKVSVEDRRILLMAGMSAGFGAAIGAPWAGAIFGIEAAGAVAGKWRSLIACGIAAFAANTVAIFVHAPHTHFPAISVPPFLWESVLVTAAAGALFGVTARLFVAVTLGIQEFMKQRLPIVWLQPFLGGLFLVGSYKFFGLGIYAGLGLPLIQGALEFPPPLKMFALKALLTAVTIGSGFKGGEFIPLVMVGTTLGSALGQWSPVAYPFAGALGFAAVFAGASKTPLACSFMAAEIFGPQMFPFALIACFISRYFAGQQGIYTKIPARV